MAVASDVMRAVMGADARNGLSRQNGRPATIPRDQDNANSLTVREEIKDLEIFIDDMCDQDELKAIQLYDKMSLELKAEVSFLRKLNQATLLQDVSKNQTNNSLLRDEIMQMRRELRMKNNLVKLLCSPEIGASPPGKDLLEQPPPQNTLCGSQYNMLRPAPPSPGGILDRSGVKMLGSSEGNVDSNTINVDKLPEGKVEVVGDFMLNNMQIRELNRIHNVKINFIYGCMTYDLVSHVQRILPGNMHKIIIHVGTNDVSSNTAIMKNVQKITKYVKEKSPSTQLVFSSIIVRKDREILTDRIRKTNAQLMDHCSEEGIGFVDNSNITETSLDVSRVHLNRKGNSLLAKNILVHIVEE